MTWKVHTHTAKVKPSPKATALNLTTVNRSIVLQCSGYFSCAHVQREFGDQTSRGVGQGRETPSEIQQ